MDIGKHIKRLGLDRLLEKAADDGAHNQRAALAEHDAAAPTGESSTSVLRAMSGSIGYVGEPYFPAELIGGTCPRVPGEEEEIVWNAAAEACDSERVHVVWQCHDNRIWYLAVRSSDLASHPNSWCPMAAFLPGSRGVADPPVCYTYFGEEVAVLMTVNSDGLQIFRGTAPVVRAKAERMSREMGQAPVVNIDLDRIEQLAPVPWYSLSLFENRARRVLATLSVLAALLVCGVSFLVWLSANMAQMAAHHDLRATLERTQEKSMALLTMAENARSSPLRDQVTRFLNVNDGLLALNGFLQVYEIKDGKSRWRAIVPPSATAERITAIGGKNIESTDRGVAIGNDIQIAYERETGKKQ